MSLNRIGNESMDRPRGTTVAKRQIAKINKEWGTQFKEQKRKSEGVYKKTYASGGGIRKARYK